MFIACRISGVKLGELWRECIIHESEKIGSPSGSKPPSITFAIWIFLPFNNSLALATVALCVLQATLKQKGTIVRESLTIAIITCKSKNTSASAASTRPFRYQERCQERRERPGFAPYTTCERFLFPVGIPASLSCCSLGFPSVGIPTFTTSYGHNLPQLFADFPNGQTRS
jgi:hypothetical protein